MLMTGRRKCRSIFGDYKTSCIHIGYFGSPNPRDEDYGTFDESTRSFSFRISITDGEIDKGAYFEFE